MGASQENRIELRSETLKQLKKCLSHRGPDCTSALIKNNHLLVHNRLSIIDLTDSAVQPMKHYEREIYIVFNGEIYNFKELANKYLRKSVSRDYRSDTRVLLEMYAAYGDSKFSELQGIFAFAIIDLEAEKTVLCRDHFGIKPLVYSIYSRNLFFASEAKGIIAMNGEKYSCDLNTMSHYLSTGQVSFNGRTFFQGISELEPGTSLTYCHKTKQATIKKYFVLEESVLERMESFETEELVIQRFLSSLESNMTSDVPVVVALSSGLDSYTILSSLMQMGMQIPKVFSYGFEDANYDESRVASALSDSLGIPINISRIDQTGLINHLQEAIRYFETPLGGVGTFGLYLMCSSIKAEGIKVVLTGEGADELFGGYDYYFSGYYADIINPIQKLKFIKTFGAKRGLNYFASHKKLSLITGKRSLAPDGTFSAISSSIKEQDLDGDIYNLNCSEQFSEAQRLQLTDIKFRKLPKLLHFLDRSGSANGIEARVPFLDKELVLSALAMSGRSHYGQGLGKQVLRNFASDASYKEPKVKKWVATPQREWLRGEFGKWGVQLYREGLLRTSGFIDDAKFLRRVTDYRSAKTTPENSFFFWQAISLELLLRNYPQLV